VALPGDQEMPVTYFRQGRPIAGFIFGAVTLAAAISDYRNPYVIHIQVLNG
jgi:hypothetical protein